MPATAVEDGGGYVTSRIVQNDQQPKMKTVENAFYFTFHFNLWLPNHNYVDGSSSSRDDDNGSDDDEDGAVVDCCLRWFDEDGDNWLSIAENDCLRRSTKTTASR